MTATQPPPGYDELPIAPDLPAGSSWGVWGRDDVFGCLNLLDAGSGLAEAREGRVFSLNLEMELPDPPMFGRASLEHVVTDLGNVGHDEVLHNWNTQASTQWDGFRHLRHPAWGHYNGLESAEHGVHFWARRGLVGRGVLADVARWRAHAGRPIVPDESDAIDFTELAETLRWQGSSVGTGDVLLVRTGWVGWYKALSEAARAAVDVRLGASHCGLRRGVATAKGLWDLHISAVAADNPGLESMPAGPRDPEEMVRWRDFPERAAESMLHFALLGLLGMPIGELFDLEALAEDCAADGRYTFLITSAPANLRAGVGTPANALAIK